MVGVIAATVAVVVVLGILYAVPRYVGSSGASGAHTGTAPWPDLLGGLDRIARRWVAHSRLWDAVLGIVTIALLAAAIMIYQDPAMLGSLEESVRPIAHVLGILGLIGLFSTAYASVRRAGLSGAEATFIGSALAGTVLLLLVAALLIQ